MKFNTFLYCFLLNCILVHFSFSQGKQIDSLKNLLKTSSSPASSAEILIKIADLYSSQNVDSSLFYSQKALEAAKVSRDKKLLANAYYLVADAYKNKGAFDSANSYFFSSLAVYEELKDFENCIRIKVFIGDYFRAIENFEKGIEIIRQAIKLSFQKKIYKHLPYAYNRLSSICFEQSYLFYKTKDNEKTAQTIVFVDSSFYWSEKLKIKDYISSNYNIYGAVYKNIKKFDKAQYYLIMALKEQKKEGNLLVIPNTYCNLAYTYCDIGNYSKAVESANEGAYIADSLNYNPGIFQNFSALTFIYTKTKDYKNALLYHNKLDSIGNIIYNVNSKNLLKELETKYKTKEKETLLKQKETELSKNKRTLIFSALGILFLLVLLFLILRLSLRRKKTNRILEEKNEEIEAKNKELKELNHFRDDMTSMIVHDLKNPLSTIINFSRIINETKTQSEIIEKSENIENNALKMIHLVNNIIDIQKLEEAKILLNKQQNSINAAVSNSIENLNFFINQKNIQIENKFTDNLISVFDKELIERVITNLLTNAIKFTENNGTITIDYELENELVKVKITDQGQGIPPDKIHLLFNKYSRAEIRKLGFSSSSGLGLAFCKLVTEAHNEKIGVVSEVGKGSCFWFTLQLLSIEKTEKLLNKQQNVQLDNDFELEILPLKKMLSEFNFYETSEIIDTIAEFECKNYNFANWKQQVENAVLFSNQSKYLELIKI